MNRLCVLTYQKIGVAPKNSPLKKEWTSLPTLTRTLDKIKKRGWTTVSPSQILAGNLPEKSVLLLFLDGYRSFYDHVYPLLKARGLSACVCLSAACVGTYNQWQDPHAEFWQDVLSWDELKILAKDPLISFGAQSLNREDITRLAPQQARYATQENLFRLTKSLSKPPELLAVFPAKKSLKNKDEILTGFDGLILSPAGNITKNSPVSVKIVRGNSWYAI